MVATVHVLHPQPSVIGGFLRIGHTGHRRIEALHASGKLRFNKFVFDAGHIGKQIELLKALKTSGCETVLDPNFAEMATVGGFDSSVRKLPWANADTPWKASDFGRRSNLNPARLIAEFAIKHGVDAVLAPSNLVETLDDDWWAVDRTLCDALRLELDRNGGSGIAIDYQVITSNSLLRDPRGREKIISVVENLPIQNVWLKISGFGATATGAGTRAYISPSETFMRPGGRWSQTRPAVSQGSLLLRSEPSRVSATASVKRRAFKLISGNGLNQVEAEGLELGFTFLISIDISPKNNLTRCSR